ASVRNLPPDTRRSRKGLVTSGQLKPALLPYGIFATRKPSTKSVRTGSTSRVLQDARHAQAESYHEPPRGMPRCGDANCCGSVSHAERSATFDPVETAHSRAFPIMSCSPKPLGRNDPTGALTVYPSLQRNATP